MTERMLNRIANIIAFALGLGGMALLALIVYLVEMFA